MRVDRHPPIGGVEMGHADARTGRRAVFLASSQPAGRLFAAVFALLTLACALAASAASTPNLAKHHQASPPRSVAGTLTAEELGALVAQMTFSEKIGMVNGTNDPACPAPLPSPPPPGCFGQVWNNPGVARLGIPRLRLTDGPAGIRLSHFETAMPAPVGLAATFSRFSAREYGAVMGREGRASNQDVLLAPMINQVNFVTAGRNFETLGEDPFLMAELVGPEVEGIQGEGLIATIKHYAENDFENGRNSTSVAMDERTLHETELQAFEAGVHAGAGAVMCSFNRVNDVFGCSNGLLLTDVLRARFGFAGFVMTDFGASHFTSDMQFGLDMDQPGNLNTGRFSVANLTNAVTNGTPAVPLTNDFPAVPAFSAAQWQAALDRAVFRILTAENGVGLLEGTQFGSQASTSCSPGPAPPCTPVVPPRPDLDALRPSSFRAAQRVAERSATLLKNDHGALPLGKHDIRDLVLMGPTAVATYVGGGGSAHVTPAPGVPSPYEALVEDAGSRANVRFVPGYDLDGEVMPSSAIVAPAPFAGQNGWLRQQITTAAVPSGSEPVLQPGGAPDQLDPTVDYVGARTLPAGTAWRWQGTFTAPAGGPWQLKVFVKNQSSAQLYVDGLAINPNRRINIGAYGIVGGFGASTVPTWDGLAQANKSHEVTGLRLQQATFATTFAAGEAHTLDLRAYANAVDSLEVRFAWVPPDWQSRKIAEAVAAAENARAVVFFAYDDGTEGADRGGNDQVAGLNLPGYQNEAIAAVAAANRNTIVVLNTGDAVLMPWASDVAAILELWYPGQRGGPATANVLLGEVNPSGRLPITFPPDGTHFPTFDPGCDPAAIVGGPTPNDGNCPLYPGVFRPGFLSGNHGYKTVDMTTNGIFQGYRWYDRHDITSLYPFGHGLSYTRFSYSHLIVRPTWDGYDVTFRVRNTGRRDGAEVPQLYLGAPARPPNGLPFAEKALAGFRRIELDRGHAKWVTIHVGERALSYWSTASHDWEAALGKRPLYVGSSSRDVRLQATINVGRRSHGGKRHR
jgi:beta-glucosidase